jgi:hypothetical protein
MVKAPAIGQRSIRATRLGNSLGALLGDLLEVISGSGNFLTASLPGATKYGWLGTHPASNGDVLEL